MAKHNNRIAPDPLCLKCRYFGGRIEPLWNRQVFCTKDRIQEVTIIRSYFCTDYSEGRHELSI